MTLPRPLAPFLSFAQALRAAGHLAAPEQTQAFIAAVGLIGPRSLMDVRRAAHATFGPMPERREEFDALFDEIFLGRVLTAPAPGEPEDMPNAFDAGAFEPDSRSRRRGALGRGCIGRRASVRAPLCR